jgi:CO dehydrogenase/acetyl-CoA synthase delta subunit
MLENTEFQIDWRNKDNGLMIESKFFDCMADAKAWGRANLENFHTDMIKIF